MKGQSGEAYRIIVMFLRISGGIKQYFGYYWS